MIIEWCRETKRAPENSLKNIPADGFVIIPIVCETGGRFADDGHSSKTVICHPAQLQSSNSTNRLAILRVQLVLGMQVHA